MPDPENGVAALSGPMREEARTALASRLERAVLQRRSMQERSMRALELTHDAVRGLLESNAAWRAGMAQLWKETAEEVRRVDAKERVAASIDDRHLAALEDRAVLHTVGGGGSFTGASPPNHLDESPEPGAPTFQPIPHPRSGQVVHEVDVPDHFRNIRSAAELHRELASGASRRERPRSDRLTQEDSCKRKSWCCCSVA